MQIQIRFINLLLVAALSASGLGSMRASPTSVHTADAAKSARQPENRADGPAVQTDQDRVPRENPPLPTAVLNTELKALDGSTIRLADYQGKVVLVNLWATWCGPCRSEIPNLVKVSKEFRAKGVEIIGLTNEDPETEAEKVQEFVSEFKITYQIGWGEQDFTLALMQGQLRNNIPQTFVISRDGRVLKRFVGFSHVETPRKLRLALEDALNEK